jgi:hypothetical protein
LLWQLPIAVVSPWAWIFRASSAPPSLDAFSTRGAAKITLLRRFRLRKQEAAFPEIFLNNW